MKARILKESETWKKLKAEKEQKNNSDGKQPAGDGGTTQSQPAPPPEESDDEIEVSEVRHVKPSPKKPVRRSSGVSALRLR